jgi:CheY-like chemotaxis protein
VEADRLQARKMEALGRLASGIAHDFNNLLTVINGYGQMLLGRVGREHEWHEQLFQIVRAGERAAGFARQLLLFGSKQPSASAAIDLNALLTDYRRTLAALVGPGIELHIVQADSLPAIEAAPVQILQILLNLAANARDAMPLGGQLLVETGRGYPPAANNPQAARSGGAAPPPTGADGARLEQTPPLPAAGGASWVLLRVRDTGCGMTDDVRQRLFEPALAAQANGRPTGLGLSIVAELVRQLHGSIDVVSALNQGTTVTVYLPPVEPAPASLPASVPGTAALAGQPTVLVVEDNECVRTLMQRVLQGQGYEVLAAGSGTEALTLTGQRQQPINLLLTDVSMPHMSGQQLAEQLHGRWPGLPVLLLSGCSPSELEQPSGVHCSFLQKPFTLQELLGQVHTLVRGGNR